MREDMYQSVANRLDAIACIRIGLEQADKGLYEPIDEVFKELEAELEADIKADAEKVDRKKTGHL
jgi:predicted transcriptional regulator